MIVDLTDDIDAAFREFVSDKTRGWARIGKTSYLIKKDGGSINLHLRSDAASGEGSMFFPEYDFEAMAQLFAFLAVEHRRRFPDGDQAPAKK